MTADEIRDEAIHTLEGQVRTLATTVVRLVARVEILEAQWDSLPDAFVIPSPSGGVAPGTNHFNRRNSHGEEGSSEG